MRVKRTGMMTKILILMLMVVTAVTYLNLQGELGVLLERKAVMESQNARKRQENEALAAAIAEKDDPQRIADVARDRLGYVAPGEIVFYDSGN